MTPEQKQEQDRELANADTARIFHLHAIEHHERALQFHREAIKFHGLGDISNAAQNALLALTHTQHAGEHALSANQHYVRPAA